MHIVSAKNVGPPNTPQEIKRFRRQNMDFCRWIGQPVVMRHLWNLDDVATGKARKCPACYDSAYEQVRNDCPVCFGFGYASVENNALGLYINTSGQIVVGNPGTGVLAPRYGAFDQPFLTWIVEPDVAVDVFKINEHGVMVQTYDASAVAPWFPKLGDNDLCINVDLGRDGTTILATNERFQLKMVQQASLRGWGRRTRGQVHTIAQSFQMSKAPDNTSIYQVPADAA